MIRIVGVVILCVACEFHHVCVLVSGVHPMAIVSAVFCVNCSLLMFVSDTSGHYIVETYSSMDFAMARIVEESGFHFWEQGVFDRICAVFCSYSISYRLYPLDQDESFHCCCVYQLP